MMKKMRLAFFIVLTTILLFNLTMLLYAVYEYRYYKYSDEWYYSTQTFDPIGVPLNRTIILLHGFVGSPNDFRPYTYIMRMKGYRVKVLYLPEQSARHFAYLRGRWGVAQYSRWLLSEVDSVAAMDGVSPFIIGFSMGGALVANVIDEVQAEKIVLISPFFGLVNNYFQQSAKIFASFIPIVPKLSKGKINSREGYDEYYPGSFIVSLRAFNRLTMMSDSAAACLRQANRPMLVIASKNDEVADYTKTFDIVESNNLIQIKTYTESNHILMYDYETESVLNDILEWFEPIRVSNLDLD